MFLHTPQSHLHDPTDDGELNRIQGILIRSVEMQKNLDEMQNMLYLRLSNAKDFDRGCRNLKHFALHLSLKMQNLLHFDCPRSKSFAFQDLRSDQNPLDLIGFPVVGS
jgi:hypothetical protein